MNLLKSSCSTSCAIALVFFISSFYMSYSSKNNTQLNDFIGSLTPELQDKYKTIVDERHTIYYQGMGLAILLSLLIILFNVVFAKKMLSTITLLCTTGAVSFFTTYFYYILSPKTKSIITDLDNFQQRDLWLKVYKKMQWNYHIGLLLGLIGVLFMSGLC